MWYGAIEFDILLGPVASRKEKRSVVRPIIADLKRHEVSASEVGHLDLHQRSLVGVVYTASDHARLVDVLDRVERLVAERPETELLATRRRVHNIED